MVSSIKQPIKNGRGRDKNGRKMNPNSLKNLNGGRWKKGESGNPQGQSITTRQKQMMLDICPFDARGRTWLEALAEGGMRQALITPVALNNLQDRHEGKITQPLDGLFEIKDTRELTDEQLAVIAATNIFTNNALRSGNRATRKASGP